jgi:hypothetical protein
MRPATGPKVRYAAMSIVFTVLFVSMMRAVLAAQVDVEWVARTLAPLVGVAAMGAAGTGWSVGRRLGLSRGDAGALALGSVLPGVHLVVLAWILLRRAPAAPPPGEGSRAPPSRIIER